jgi:choline dehydrogenase-like flavoprotein
MFVDARTLSQRFVIDADVCIIGAGAAGITLARDLSGGSRKIALFESGNFDFDADTQKLYAGEVVQQAYIPLDRDRLRYFGGSTNHWQGSCRPFDALDLADWPFGPEVLEPYYRRAHDICQLGPYTFDPADWSTAEARPLELSQGSGLKSGVFQYSPPTRFGTVYRNDLAAAAGVTVYLNANLVQIESDESASNVTGVEIACLDGKRGRVRAKNYVLAAGGIENARLLLNANRVQKSGLGNAFDLVGRYFMDHPFVPAAATIFADDASPEMHFYDQHVVRGRIVEGYFCASDEVRRREKLPPFAIGIRSANAGIDAGVGNIKLPAMLRHLMSDSLDRKVTYYLPRILDRLETPVTWVYNKMWRKPPGHFITAYSCGPDPDPQSRVTLIDTVDALGTRMCRLAWRLPADFEQSMHRAHELLAQELGRSGIGRLRIESSSATGYDPMQDLGNGSHHMGTTRMHDDPHHGVVNADCRVHGISNLFIGGSAVFPSYACDDPTLTIVALALRLSDHLKSSVS